jgi:hypothetical protein
MLNGDFKPMGLGIFPWYLEKENKKGESNI